MCPDATANDNFYGVQSVLHVKSLVPNLRTTTFNIPQTHSHCLYLTWLGLSSPETLVFNCDGHHSDTIGLRTS